MLLTGPMLTKPFLAATRCASSGWTSRRNRTRKELLKTSPARASLTTAASTTATRVTRRPTKCRLRRTGIVALRMAAVVAAAASARRPPQPASGAGAPRAQPPTSLPHRFSTFLAFTCEYTCREHDATITHHGVFALRINERLTTESHSRRAA